jgi:hypothetical protein
VKLKFSIQPQLQILEQAMSLLQKTLDAAIQAVRSPGDLSARQVFVYRHARNIRDLAKDVVALGKLGSLGSIYLLTRPALESLFKLAAATNEANFAIEKLVAEIAEERKKFEAWSAAGEPLWDAVLKKVIDELKEGESDLRQRYEVNRELRWKKIWEVAKTGKLQVEYVRDYFVGSKHVHAMVSALVDREDGCLYIIEALHRLTATVCRAAELTNEFFCVSPSIFEDASKIETQSTNSFGQVQEQLEEQLKEHFNSTET